MYVAWDKQLSFLLLAMQSGSDISLQTKDCDGDQEIPPPAKRLRAYSNTKSYSSKGIASKGVINSIRKMQKGNQQLPCEGPCAEIDCDPLQWRKQWCKSFPLFSRIAKILMHTCNKCSIRKDL